MSDKWTTPLIGKEEITEDVKDVQAMDVVEKVEELEIQTKPQVSEVSPVLRKVEKYTVSLDNTPENVVLLDTDGVELYFDDGPERFLKLPSDVVKGLGAQNKERYSLAYGSYLILQEEADVPDLDIAINGRYAPASGKLEVFNKQPGMHYVWKRPDELRASIQIGYRVTKNQKISTFGSDPTTTHRVSSLGEDELILMEISEEGFEKIDAQNRALAQRREGAADAQARREIAADGLVFDPTEEHQGRFNFSAPHGTGGQALPNTG